MDVFDQNSTLSQEVQSPLQRLLATIPVMPEGQRCASLLGIGPPTPGTLMAAAGAEQSKRQLYKLCVYWWWVYQYPGHGYYPSAHNSPKQVRKTRSGEIGELDGHSQTVKWYRSVHPIKAYLIHNRPDAQLCQSKLGCQELISIYWPETGGQWFLLW